MSKIEDLIRQFCPDGVEWRTIESLTKSICSGLNPRRNFSLNVKGADCNYLTVKEMTSGKIVFSDKTDKITKEAVGIIQNRSRLEFGDILLSGIGTIGRVAIVDIPVGDWNCSESVLLLKADQTLILPKYLKYILEGNEVQVYFNNHATGSTLKGIRQKDLRSLEIPLPPLPVQEAIVNILDRFAVYAAELQAELQARQQQYNYYRDTLLSFEGRDDVQWKKLGEVCKVLRGKRLTKSQLSSDGMYKVFHGGIEPIGFFDQSNREGDTTMVINVGASAGTVGFSKEAFWSSDGCFCLSHTPILSGRFLYYYLQTKEPILMSRVRKAGIPTLDGKVLEDIPIPIIPIIEQERIISILNRFDTLVNDLSQGLPAEIEARQQQYEYYRDQLLTFKRKEA